MGGERRSAGTVPQIRPSVLACVLACGLLKNVCLFRSQREAAWGITNLTMGGTPAQLDALVAAGFLEPYCRLLESTDLRSVVVVLDGLANLLQVRCARRPIGL